MNPECASPERAGYKTKQNHTPHKTMFAKKCNLQLSILASATVYNSSKGGGKLHFIKDHRI